MRYERLLLIATIISMCIWGTSWSSGKILSGYGSPSAIAFMRFFLVPVTLLPIFYFLKIDFKVSKKGIWHLLAAGFILFLYTLTFFRGLQLGQPGAAGVLVTTMNPLLAYMLGLIISRIVPTPRNYWVVYWTNRRGISS